MMVPAARAAAAIGPGAGPEVVTPSVNMTMTRALDEVFSKSPCALAKASPWFVPPPAVRPFIALLRSATEVSSGDTTVAVASKLTMPMRLPEPISPEPEPPVDSEMMSINVFAPSFMSASGAPLMLPEQSSASTMSVGLVTISGAAVRARVILNEPSQHIAAVSATLLELVTPIWCCLLPGMVPGSILCRSLTGLPQPVQLSSSSSTQRSSSRKREAGRDMS